MLLDFLFNGLQRSPSKLLGVQCPYANLVEKNKGTVYIQTWHGTPLKKLGIDISNVAIPGAKTEAYKREFSEEANRWDYLIAPNQFSKEIFQRAFHYHHTF